MFSKWKTLSASIALVLSSSPCWAAEFRAEVDRDDIAMDESVTLKLLIQADGSVPVEAPSFSAPQFDVINQYQSQSVESYFENGKVGARFSRAFTFVLRPQKTGKYTITDIQVNVEGQKQTAAPIPITVRGGGEGTPPPKGYGGGGAGLRGSGKAPRGSAMFVRAEVDKNKVFKGEQVVVSYFLYSRAAQFNAQAEKFPVLPGFLKEELEMPVVQGRLQDDVVTLDGQVYKRVLLARFAAYPLKEGKLSIDPFGVKVTYFEAKRSRTDDPFEDAEDLFQQFFNQAAPQTANLRSEPVSIEVAPLPAPIPDHFTGAVGDFSVVSAVNRYDLRANEALNLTLKVEGEGNLSTIDVPKISLPREIEVFESRAQTRAGRGGVGVRVFEYVLIPRKAGDWTIPEIELSFFDPKSKSYVTRKTDPIPIHVGEGDPNAPAPTTGSSVSPDGNLAVPEKAIPKFYDLKDRVGAQVERWRSGGAGGRLGVVLFLLFGVLGVVLKLSWPKWAPRIRKWRGRDPEALREKDWEKVVQSVEVGSTAPTSLNDVLKAYEQVANRIYDALDVRYGLGARALSRSELREALVVENKMDQNYWNRIAELLEFTETVRFAAQAGAVSEERIRSELKKWIQEAAELDRSLRQKN